MHSVHHLNDSISQLVISQSDMGTCERWERWEEDQEDEEEEVEEVVRFTREDVLTQY